MDKINPPNDKYSNNLKNFILKIEENIKQKIFKQNEKAIDNAEKIKVH